MALSNCKHFKKYICFKIYLFKHFYTFHSQQIDQKLVLIEYFFSFKGDSPTKTFFKNFRPIFLFFSLSFFDKTYRTSTVFILIGTFFDSYPWHCMLSDGLPFVFNFFYSQQRIDMKIFVPPNTFSFSKIGTMRTENFNGKHFEAI